MIISPASAPVEGPFHRVEIFGDSFFEQDGENAGRVAAYLRILGVDTLKPHKIRDMAQSRPSIEGNARLACCWLVTVVDGTLVINLSP